MTRSPHLGAVLALSVLFAFAGPAFSQPGGAGPQGGGGMMMPGGPWGGGQGMQFEMFLGTITQLNMTPDFTLDKQAKQTLQDLRDDWRKAQAKFMEDHREELRKIQQQTMEAYKAKDMDDVKMANQKLQDLFAKGPKADEYIAKAKAALSPEQLKAVEEKLVKDDEQRKAMMERWRKMQPNPGPTTGEKK